MTGANAKIKRILTWVNEVRLPAEYQEVEYIENSGTQYIDTGVRVPNHKVIANIEYTNFGTRMSLGAYLGPDGGVPGGQARLYGGYGNDIRNWSYGFLNDFGNYGGSVSSNTKYELEVSTISGNMYFKHDGTTYGNSSSTYSTSLAGNFGILGTNGTQTWEAWNSAKVYDYKIYDNTNTLIRDFVPCYRKSDDEIGMYDLITDTFYTNNGTGTFTKGNDVPNLVEKQIYPAGWKPGENTIAYYPLTSTSTVNDLSGNSRNLTNHSVSFNTYDGVNCAYFNGSSQYLNQDSVNMGLFNGNMTVNFYMKSNGGDNQVVLCNWFGKPYTGFYILYDNGLLVNSASGTPQTNTLQSGWNMVTCTNDSSTLKVYINGVLTETRGLAVSTSTSTKLYLGAIGNDVDGLRAYFNGYISEVILEKTIRTADEVSNYYNQTKSNYGL